jgi:hypothetical protein
MGKYFLGMSVGAILVLISGVGLSASAQTVPGTDTNGSGCFTVCITSVQTIPTHPVVGGTIHLYGVLESS